MKPHGPLVRMVCAHARADSRKGTGIPAERVSFRRLQRPPSTRVSPVNRFLFLLSAATAALTLPAAAQQTDPSRLTVQRIYGSPEFFSQPFGPSRWLDDGSAYTTIEPSADGAGQDIVRYDVEKGSREVLVAASQLVPKGAEAAARYRGLRLVARRQQAAGVHQHPAGLAAQHTRRLLGARPDRGRTPEARRRRGQALHADVRQVLARRPPRGLRAREQPLRRGSRRRGDRPAHHATARGRSSTAPSTGCTKRS